MMFFFDGMGIFGIFFFLIFALVLITFITTAVRGIGTWHKNNQSPRLTVDARIVAKRTNVSHHHRNNASGNGMNHTTTSTSYYVTFQVESGDRMELSMDGSEYGLLAEGDEGKLTFQGTRYLGFERRY